jgi:hypothetical protein
MIPHFSRMQPSLYANSTVNSDIIALCNHPFVFNGEQCMEWGEPTGLAASSAVVVSGVVVGGEGAISGLFWQQRMPEQQGYLHPYTNLTSTPDLCPDLENKRKEKNRRSICR